MFNTIDEAIEWIQNRRNTGHSFEKFKEFCSKIGNPQNNFYYIHVTGTNGKGSTIAYLRDMLMSQGYKVGTLQSPHYITHLDRIRINNKNIPGEVFLNILNKNYELYINNDLSMFEIDYLIMCEYFLMEKVDFAIVEVGIGGRLDATNVVDNTKLSIITTIDYDHMDLLGNSLLDICREKCGIIKNNSKVLVGKLPISCYKLISFQANTHSSLFYVLNSYEKTGIRKFKYDNEEYKILSYADYQIYNVCLALEAFNIIKKDCAFNVNLDALKKAISQTNWNNRFEIVKQNPTVILDGAHNLHGILAATSSFDKFKGSKCIVFSALKRKEYRKMVDELKKHCDKLIITKFSNSESIDLEEFADLQTYENYIEAIDYAVGNFENVLICGSLYFLSDVVLNYNF